jgi:two-component system phosphate regulon sensor histidine kinase PhoR
MSRLRWLALLMIIAILGITGFQVYWLRQNYAREKRTLAIKTDMLFRETILQLQVSKLRLDAVPQDSTPGKMKIILHEKEGDQVNMRVKRGEEMVSTVNVIRDKLGRKPVTRDMVISMNHSTIRTSADSGKVVRSFIGPPARGNGIINLLYSVDSLQEPVRREEIDSAFRLALKEEKINIPYSIVKVDSAGMDMDPQPNTVTIGFTQPMTYQLQTGNTVPYLFRQITQPILFSILLLGITVLSFSLLYRNLIRQRRLAALKNEFISNITHELKTPIATVGVAIEALKNFNAMNDTRRTREYLDISQNELQRLGLLVDKVLRLSMFEKKEIELKYEPLDMGQVVDEVLASLRLQLEKANATLSVVRNGDLLMEGDRLHLLSVVFNLVDNAVKYSDGNPEIGITLTGKDTAIVIDVADRGIGIPAPYRSRVFEKFFRVPHGDTHNAPGYGLGLSYACQVVRKHGGDISAHGREGAGTVFTITLPKKKPL